MRMTPAKAMGDPELGRWAAAPHVTYSESYENRAWTCPATEKIEQSVKWLRAEARGTPLRIGFRGPSIS
jgi:hypothetical protein